MRYEFQITEKWVGFAESAARPPDKVVVDGMSFLSTEDGAKLLMRLEAISRMFHVGQSGIPESQIDHLIAIIHPEGRIEVVINEVPLIMKMRPKRTFTEGEAVWLDDIVDIETVDARGLQVPDNAGYVILFSVGWQKGLLYDFTPFHADFTPSDRHLSRLLAAAFSYLMFRDRFTLSELEWVELRKQQWFPFVGLSHDIIQEMVNHVRAGWPVDDLLPRIVEHVRADLPSLGTFIQDNEAFRRHRVLLKQVIDAFERREYAMVTQSLFSRVEGILRDHANMPKPKQSELTGIVEERIARHEKSLLMPSMFRTYLTETVFCFESFADPKKVSRVTRHSVAHGVADDALLNEKAATIGLLIFRQLGYLLTDGRPTGMPKPGANS